MRAVQPPQTTTHRLALGFHIVSIALAGLLFTGTATWANGTLKGVMDLSPAIYDVKGMGQWSMGSKSGQIRLVITRDSKRDQVFLQWVVWRDKQPHKVESTIGISELNQEDRYSITFIRREADDHGRQIVLGLEDRHTKEALRAFIRIKEMGLYQCHIKR